MTNSSETKPAESQLDKAVRAIVAQEMAEKLGVSLPSVPKPTVRDACFFLLLIAEAVLLVKWIPQGSFKDERVEFLSKLVPWLGGGAFFIGFGWFREHALSWTRGWIFRGFLIVAFAITLTMNFPLFSVSLQVPPMAKVFLDNSEDPLFKGDEKGYDKQIRLPLGRYKFKMVREPGGFDNEKECSLTMKALLSTIWKQSFQLSCDLPPVWAIVQLSVSDKGSQIEIQRLEGSLPDGSERTAQLPDQEAQVSKLNATTLLVKLEPNALGFSIKLPTGKYQFKTKKQGCDSSQEERIVAPQMELGLPKLKCDSK